MLKNKKNNTILTVVLFALAAVVILFPLYITVVIALKTPEQIAQSVLAFPDKLHFENFITAIEKTNFFVTFKKHTDHHSCFRCGNDCHKFLHGLCHYKEQGQENCMILFTIFDQCHVHSL